MNALTRIMSGPVGERARRVSVAGASLHERGVRIGGVLGDLLGRTSRTAFVLYALGLGTVLGLVTADYATRGGYPLGGTRIGAWTAWPKAGALDADPYSRAVDARRGDIPLAVGEGLLLTATSDDGGRRLDASCSYAIGGAVPPARAWTLAVRGGDDSGTKPLRLAFTSTEILRDADDRFIITLSRDVASGNWLPLPQQSGPIHLALRLYDTPVAASVGTLDRNTVPAVTLIGCGA